MMEADNPPKIVKEALWEGPGSLVLLFTQLPPRAFSFLLRFEKRKEGKRRVLHRRVAYKLISYLCINKNPYFVLRLWERWFPGYFN